MDLTAGVAITAIGIDALAHVDGPNERPLAALPLIFGIHQLIETAVWWGVDGEVSAATAQWSAWLYLAVAFGLLPWFVPWAVQLTELQPQRRRLMQVLVWLGALVAAVLMLAVMRGPIEVSDGGNYLVYEVPLAFGGLLVAAYVLATCGSLLLSSDRHAVQFGAINLLVVIILAVMLSNGVISLWCIWAAITSGVVALHLRRTDPHTNRFRSLPASS